MNFLLNVPVELIILVILGMLAVLLFMLIWAVARNNFYLRKLVSPLKDRQEEAERDAKKIIHEAIQSTHEMRVKAEEDEFKHLSLEKKKVTSMEHEHEKILLNAKEEITKSLESYKKEVEISAKKIIALTEEEFRKELPRAEEASKETREKITATLETIEKRIRNTEEAYNKFLSSLEKIVDEQFSRNREIIEESLIKIPHKFDEAIALLEKESKKIIYERIDKEFEKARVSIEEYKKSHTMFVDSSIEALVEKATELSVGHILNKGEHIGLILRSLEEARKDSVFTEGPIKPQP